MESNGNGWKLQKQILTIQFHVEYHSHVQSSVAAALLWKMAGRLVDLGGSGPKLAGAAEQALTRSHLTHSEG